jgi:hypothetical protein
VTMNTANVAYQSQRHGYDATAMTPQTLAESALDGPNRFCRVFRNSLRMFLFTPSPTRGDIAIYTCLLDKVFDQRTNTNIMGANLEMKTPCQAQEAEAFSGHQPRLAGSGRRVFHIHAIN